MTKIVRATYAASTLSEAYSLPKVISRFKSFSLN